MDSKYSAIGNGGGNVNKFNSKRAAIFSKPAKKLKLVNKDKPPDVDHTIITPKEVVRAEQLLDQRRKLPVYLVRMRLLEEIRKNETCIIIGETGSGKTTQIPQMIHEVRMEGQGMVGVTQPRRVAAITIAMRVASEMNTRVGEIVGYTVRFEDVSSSKTKVKYLTDGMLLREAMGDPLLLKYSVIVLDEAHERTVSTDVLFGIIKLAQKERKEQKTNQLKIIVMSATMDVDTFSSYFDNCPVIYLEGRTYPVTIYHAKQMQHDYQHATLCTIFQLHSSTPINCDFLVFLTGQEEIESLTYNIKQISKEVPGPQIRVCALYAGLPPSRQLEAWKASPVGTRKIVLATNIAETSITIPNIKYVIDCGFVKERTFCVRTGSERLAVRPCAKAACWQRAGRAGRSSPGNCYRLFTSNDMEARPAHTVPEILRCPLASTVLWMIAIKVEPATFPLLDPLPPAALQAAIQLLHQLGALDYLENAKLTPIGRKMSAFPIDPKFSRFLLAAPEYECVDEALSIVAILSSENIFHSPIHKREEALKAKLKFVSPLGDHVTLLNVFKGYCDASLKKQWCRENYLNHRNLVYAHDVRQQLSDICKRFNITQSSCGQAYDKFLKCMISGLFSNCAWLRNGAGNFNMAGGKYMTASGIGASIHPSSVLHGSGTASPACLIFTELLTTHRTYMTCVSTIEAEWLHQIVPDFARKCRMAH